jgi:hypothetical protein
MATIGENSDAHTVRAEYARCREDLKKYLAYDDYFIRHLESLGGTHRASVDSRMRDVLMEYQRLKNRDQEFSIAMRVLPLRLHIVLSVILSVLLKFPAGDTIPGAVAIGVFSSLLIGRIFNAWDHVSVLVVCWKNQNVPAAYGYQPMDETGTGAGVELAQTKRRTATSLAEEGRYRAHVLARKTI